MSDLPTGTITFLFTDIEGSTIRWERHPAAMRVAVARHDILLQNSMKTHNGAIFKTVGDAFYVAFTTAGEALLAAVQAQRALTAETWIKEIDPLRVRMAIHTGEAELRGQDYFGQTLNRVARILSSGHGGQILLSLITSSLVRDTLPADITLRDLGEHRLKDIQQPEHIFQAIVPELPADLPPLKTLDLHPNNLPTQLTPFVGRKKDLEAVCALLMRAEVRFITLTGPGGTGKTRLGLQAATSVAQAFPDGIYFVELASMREANLVASAVVQATDLRENGDQSIVEQLKQHINGRVLLLLDNFEQVMDAASFVTDLLLSCLHLKILVTSRAPLHLDGEQEYPVAPLAVPDLKSFTNLTVVSQYDAIALFIQQARAVKPDFTLTKTNARAVIEICARLDGLPLAIELAAVRINLLPPQAMLKRLGNRLKLLIGERKRSIRQQTLRGAIAWSYDLLQTHEKIMFGQLAIFIGGCTLEAIEAVCGAAKDLDIDLLDVLKSLLDKSLLRQQEQASGEPRFDMLHTIREYALEQLSMDEKETLLRLHAEYYLSLAEQAASHLTGTEQKLWLNHLAVEYENLQAALWWCAEQKEIELGLRLSGALWRFWLLRGQLHEGRRWLEAFLAMQGSASISAWVRAKALDGASILARNQNDSVRAATLAEGALQLGQELNDKEIVSGAYVTLAYVAKLHGDNQRATTLLEESLKIRRELGDRRGTASLLNNLGNVALNQGQLDLAATLQEESLALFREVDDEYAIATVLIMLGEVEHSRQNYMRASLLYEESLKLCRDLEYLWGTAASLLQLGDIACRRDDFDNAMDMYQESLAMFYEIGDSLCIAGCLEGLAEIAYVKSQLERSVRLFAQTEAIRYAIGDVVPYQYNITHGQTIIALHTILGASSFEALWKAGQALKLDHVLSEILEMKGDLLQE